MICHELGISNHAEQDATDWVTTSTVNNAVHWKNMEIDGKQVPDVTGMTLRDAIYILENLGLSVEFSGMGRVQVQSQSPGQRVLKGSQIKLKLG
jgi:cell division protein FtsI (penicillin-binding protein 3)